jgi:hypothetical protein
MPRVVSSVVLDYVESAVRSILRASYTSCTIARVPGRKQASKRDEVWVNFATV